MDETFLEAAERAATSALEEARKRIKPAPQPESVDGDCAECGDEIPPARAALGYHRCISCQSSIEQRERFRR